MPKASLLSPFYAFPHFPLESTVISLDNYCNLSAVKDGSAFTRFEFFVLLVLLGRRICREQ